MRVFRNAVVGVVTALALTVVSLGAQSATLRTIEFEATGLSTGSIDPFGVLGLSGPVNTVTGSFSFDPMATAYSEVTFGSGTINELDQRVSPYTSFSANVGGITLSGAPSVTAAERIIVQDGIGSNSSDVVQVGTFTQQNIAPGVILTLMFFNMLGAIDTFDGTGVPIVAELNNLAQDRFFQFQLFANGQSSFARYNSITFTEVPAVPLPAAFPLFLTVLAGMAGLRWWRRRATA